MKTLLEQIQDCAWERCKKRQCSLRIPVSQIIPDYPGKKTDIRYCKMEPNEILEMNHGINDLVCRGCIAASFDEKMQIYTSIKISAEQLRTLLPDKYFLEDYDAAISETISVYQNELLFQSFFDNSNAVSVLRTSFYSAGKTPWETAGEVKAFLDACLHIVNLSQKDFIRNVSKNCGLGSKVLERKIPLLLQLFFPDEYAVLCALPKTQKDQREAEEERLLDRLHIMKNYRHVSVKGRGIIKTKNGSVFILSGYGNDDVKLSENIVRDITVIQCDKVLTIENLTTFNTFPYPKNGLVVYGGGYINGVTEAFLKIVPDNVPLYHSGDLDSYGFYILEDMEKRLGRKIIPYKMDTETFLQYQEKVNDRMTEDNRKNLQEMICSDNYSEEEKSLFALMLDYDKTLEQEAIEA